VFGGIAVPGAEFADRIGDDVFDMVKELLFGGIGVPAEKEAEVMLVQGGELACTFLI